MEKRIEKLYLHNFKRFKDYTIEFDKETNIIIGDNEAGKSSILLAIDLVLSGSRSKVETAGLDNLFNISSIKEFMSSERKLEDLPVLIIDLFTNKLSNEPANAVMNGKNNSEGSSSDGLRLICAPNQDLIDEIMDSLQDPEACFPYEYYDINFITFGGTAYSNYKKYLRHMSIDTSVGESEYAMRGFIVDAYNMLVKDAKELARHKSGYRNYKAKFDSEELRDLNNRTDTHKFGLKTSTKANIETDLTIYEEGVSLENRGRGRQIFIKTEFALKSVTGKKEPDVVLIEEPESHLSHGSMHQLLEVIRESKNAQLIIATHSNMISSKLDLRKCIFVSTFSKEPAYLKSLSNDTARFFSKAPIMGILDFVLSKKVVLAEGAAEYILANKFYETVNSTSAEADKVTIASVGGLSFKRYMELAKLLGIKVAILRDNDGDHQKNCIDNYSEYITDDIRVFYDENDDNKTFELSLYANSADVCNDVFSEQADVPGWMLANKADAAFSLLESDQTINPPTYFEDALTWIKT